jgi:hypothetical protein
MLKETEMKAPKSSFNYVITNVTIFGFYKNVLKVFHCDVTITFQTH